MKLRPALPKDAGEIAAIQSDAWRLGFASLVPQDLVGAWTGYLTTGAMHTVGRGVVTVAMDGRRIAGYVSSDKARLWALFVRPEYWGKSVAQQLFDGADKLCGPGIYLHTLRGNMRARRFFERQGLSAKAEINDLYFNFEVPSLIFTR
jgi:GNAT superfamily N-acetyltransferase